MKIVLISLSNAHAMMRHAFNLADKLQEDHEVHLFGTEQYNYKDSEKYKLYKYCKTKRPLIEPRTFDFINLGRMVKKINEIKPDIIHFTSLHPWNSLISLFCFNYIKLFSLHDPVVHPGEEISHLTQLYTDFVMKYFADHILVYGEKYEDLVEEKFNKNASYVPLGEITPHSNQMYDFTKEKVVLFFGRIRSYKGISDFIKSAKYTYEKDKNIKFVVAGSGNISKYYSGTLDIPNLHIYNRFISEKEARQFFINSDIVVLPYTSATQSGVIPEAYSYGRPVIATDVGCISEMVEDNKTGYIVSSKNPKEISEKIIKLLSNKEELYIMGKNSFNKYLTEYTPAQMVKELKQVYNKIIN